MSEDEESPKEDDTSAIGYEDIQNAKKLTFQDIKEHCTGPVLSLILHVVAIAFLSTILVFEAVEEGSDIEVKEVQVDIKELEEIPEPPEPEEVEVETEVEIERPDVTTDDSEVTIEDVAIDAPAADVVMPNILSVKPTNSALVMPALFGMRSGNGRKSALKRYGGSSRTEKAVIKGLRWLKDHQNPDGSWGNGTVKHKPAFTGLALLAFLAHGESPSSPEFGPTVLKAIKKLVNFVGPEGTALTRNHSSYSKTSYYHAIATYALAEAFAVTQIPMLESIVNKSMTPIIEGLNDAGSYDYGYNKGSRSDLSVAGWNYQAMKAAYASGCTAVGLEDAIDKSIDVGLKKTHYFSGGYFNYASEKVKGKGKGKGKEKGKGKGDAKRGTMIAVGTLCLQLFGEGKSPEAKAGLLKLQDPKYFWVNWKGGPNGKTSRWSLYKWYYQTQAMFQGFSGKGGVWKKWNKMFTRELLKRQKTDGRWEPPAADKAENSLIGLDKPVYSTALCCLMLEVYYRYLPTFKVAKHKQAAVADASEGDDDDLGLKMQ